MMAAVSTSETSVSFCETTWRNVLEDGHFHNLNLVRETIFLLNQQDTRLISSHVHATITITVSLCGVYLHGVYKHH
jgi:hypothetical protein